MKELASMVAEGGGEEEEELVETVVEESTWREDKEEEEVVGVDGSNFNFMPYVITESSSKSAYVVDLTPQFDRVFVQNTFNSFREFEDLFNKFKAETGTVFRIKSSCSVAYENSRRKRHLVPSRFKFVSVRYCCVHYGQPKIAGQGIRTKQRYLPCGCECMLSLSYSRGALVISQVAMQHNHEVSSQMAPYYAINRRISNTELKQVAGMVESMPNSRALQQFLQRQFHRHTTLQDAKNIRARLKSLKMHHQQKASAIRPSTAVKPGMIKEEEEYRPDEYGERKNLTVNREVDDDDGDVYRKNRYKENGEIKKVEEENDGCEYNSNDQEQSYNHDHLNQQAMTGTTAKRELREVVTSNLQARLSDFLRDCETSVFLGRVSILNKIMSCWENGDRVDLHHCASGDNVHAESYQWTNMCGGHQLVKLCEASIQSVTSVSASSSASETCADMVIPDFDGMSVDFVPSEASGVVRPVELAVVSNSQVKEQQPCDRKGPEKCMISLHLSTENCRKLCGRKNNVLDTHEEAMEVEIEVNEDVANVKHVKLEPLEYHEVDVS